MATDRMSWRGLIWRGAKWGSLSSTFLLFHVSPSSGAKTEQCDMPC